jgi:hypothetical protein
VTGRGHVLKSKEPKVGQSGVWLVLGLETETAPPPFFGSGHNETGALFLLININKKGS